LATNPHGGWVNLIEEIFHGKQRGVSHYDLAIYIKKKNEGKFKYFTMQKYNLPKKKSSKRNQNPSRYYYYNSIITNLKFQHKPLNIIFQKNSYKNRPIIYDLRAKIP
jgi:hypothetical protein